MIGRLEKWLYLWRRKISRGRWLAGKLQSHGQCRSEPSQGLIIIQIDGLGHDQFMHAVNKKRLAYIGRLMDRGECIVTRHYSGFPSTTAAVQAELFYGVRGAVPAFHYFDKENGEDMVMIDPPAVNQAVSTFVAENSRPLLDKGTSYSNIYTGGAAEARFCIQGMRLDSIFKQKKIVKLCWLVLAHMDQLLRVVVLAVVEIFLALYDFVLGIFDRRDFFKELRFIPSRIGVCIVLRELIRLHVKIDMARGVPVIHANFVGYDEHAHRRGPDSAFAHWTLKGIDRVVRDIDRSAGRADKCDYQLVIYSDHGQEAVTPYEDFTGRSLQEALEKVLSTGAFREREVYMTQEVMPHTKLYRRSINLLKRSIMAAGSSLPKADQEKILVTAMGPLGHIYMPGELTQQEKEQYGRLMVRKAQVPLVLFKGDGILAVTGEGVFDLRADAGRVFGGDYPFLQQLVDDIERIASHPHSGDFLISGFRRNGRMLSFVQENGAHGGPGPHETVGFALLPRAWDRYRDLRPLQFRKLLLAYQDNDWTTLARTRKRTKPGRRVRVVTYNIHSCIGMDGRIRPERIGRLLAQQNVDIVGLQEVDNNQARTDRVNQCKVIAEILGMNYFFFPVIKGGKGEYGIAVLSRFPFEVIRYDWLPSPNKSRKVERRGAVWVSIVTPAGRIHFITVHLGLNRQERQRQARKIFESQSWLAGLVAKEPVIICGDLNGGPGSPVYRVFAEHLQDAVQSLSGRANGQIRMPTFFSRRPFLRLDHIFHSRHFQTKDIYTIRSAATRVASDHLPLLAELLMSKDMGQGG